MRRTNLSLGLFSVLKEELGKAKDLLSHDLTNYSKFLSGEDISDKEKKIRAKHQELAQKDAAAAAEARSKMSWRERIHAAKEELKNATKKNAAVVAMVQHCTRAHMAEIAVEQDIDVNNIHIITEGVKNEQGEEVEEKVVGYIDAPAATAEEVYAYATKLERACPAARTHGDIEWRHKSTNRVVKPSSSSSSSGLNRRRGDFDDDEFVMPHGSPFASFSTTSKPHAQAQEEEEGINNSKKRVVDFNDGLEEGEVSQHQHSSSSTTTSSSSSSFKPTNKGRNSTSDFARTAYDLGEAIEKAKAKTRKMEEEEERKIREEVLPKTTSSSSDNNKNHDDDEEKFSNTTSKKPIAGFASMKSMGLMDAAAAPKSTKTTTTSPSPNDDGKIKIPGGFQHLQPVGATKKTASSSSITDQQQQETKIAIDDNVTGIKNEQKIEPDLLTTNKKESNERETTTTTKSSTANDFGWFFTADKNKKK